MVEKDEFDPVLRQELKAGILKVISSMANDLMVAALSLGFYKGLRDSPVDSTSQDQNVFQLKGKRSSCNDEKRE